MWKSLGGLRVDRAAMCVPDGLLLDQHLVGAHKLHGNFGAALALGLINRIEDMVGETAVARAADLLGGVPITHLMNFTHWNYRMIAVALTVG